MPTPTECLLLGLMHVRPLTSYEAHKALQRLAAHHFSPSYGTLHPALKRLEKRGLLTGEELTSGGRRKRRYTLTAAGREAFHGWMHAQQVLDQGENGMLVRLFFLGLLPEDERASVVRALIAGVEAVEGTMRSQRAEAMSLARAAPPDLEDLASSQLSTLDYGIAHHRFISDWLRRQYAGLDL